MQYFDCEECGECKEISHRELIINLDSDRGTSEDIEVCADCHGDVYRFCNSIGGHMADMKQRCEKCLASQYNEDLENVDGELYCQHSGCATTRKVDLMEYRDDSRLLTWEEFKAVKDNERDHQEEKTETIMVRGIDKGLLRAQYETLANMDRSNGSWGETEVDAMEGVLNMIEEILN